MILSIVFFPISTSQKIIQDLLQFHKIDFFDFPLQYSYDIQILLFYLPLDLQISIISPFLCSQFLTIDLLFYLPCGGHSVRLASFVQQKKLHSTLRIFNSKTLLVNCTWPPLIYRKFQKFENTSEDID
ncbi:MAG: hypothetical protein MHMPM18_005213 [Marteilia pararefringens]